MVSITNAAVIYKGQVVALPKPFRHHEIALYLVETLKIPEEEWPVFGAGNDQGFMTSDGKFVNREEAAKIALEAGQCKETLAHGILHSEDLW